VTRPLYVVDSERQVERLARQGAAAKPRASLVRALLDALAPDLELASPEATRLALEIALARIAHEDALLAPLARAGGLGWARTIDALDGALVALRARARSGGR
jgi:hypothetical protein